MTERERVRQHAAAIDQLETAEQDVKRAEENLANFQAAAEDRRRAAVEASDKDLRKAEENLASLRRTLENRRKAVAEFEGATAGENLVADPSPATHVTTKATTTARGVAKFDELSSRGIPGPEPSPPPNKP
jgi:hypothetical protein